MAGYYFKCDAVTLECPVEATTYGYYPHFAANIFLAVFFGLLALFQLGFGVFSRTWSFMTALLIACVLECVGYIGRVLMNDNPWDMNAFQMQIVCLVLAPSFLAAGVYLTLKHIVIYLGPEFSRIKPHLYTWIFIGCDIGSILLQAAGGGVAASAKRENLKMLEAGNNIIITGIAFQVATMTVCGLLALEFFIRVYRSGSSRSSKVDYRSFRAFCAAEIFAYFAVLVRCIYRLPEMAGGWGNPLMQNEKEFLLLDGMMIAFSALSLTIFHPGYWFPPMRKTKKNERQQETPAAEFIPEK